MPIPKKGPRLGSGPAHQKLMIANLATSLFEHGAVTTTEARARVLRPVAERLITKAKKGDLHNRRQVLSTIRDKSVVHTLFEDIAPRYAERPGGYTRITKLGPRKGDNAPMAVIELVTEEYEPQAKDGSSPTKKAAPAPAAVEDAAVEDAAVEDEAVEDEAVEDEAAGAEGTGSADEVTEPEATEATDQAEVDEPAEPTDEATEPADEAVQGETTDEDTTKSE